MSVIFPPFRSYKIAQVLYNIQVRVCGTVKEKAGTSDHLGVVTRQASEAPIRKVLPLTPTSAGDAQVGCRRRFRDIEDRPLGAENGLRLFKHTQPAQIVVLWVVQVFELV